MNRRNKILFMVLLVVAFFGLTMLTVYADTITTAATEYVADKPCDEDSIRRVLKFFGYIFLIAKIAIPLIIIGFGTFDLFKSVIDKDEKSLSKQFKQLGMRLLAGLIVFFIPNIIYAVFSLSDTLNVVDTSDYKTCAACLLDPLDDSTCGVSS